MFYSGALCFGSMLGYDLNFTNSSKLFELLELLGNLLVKINLVESGLG